jgi:transcriptional regulator with XRE-family HTH domain
VSLLSQIERAESSASISSLYRIASALHVSMSELFADV